MKRRIGILGAGSWGIAAANLLAENGGDVVMWEFDANELALLNRERGHPKKLPGIRLHDGIIVTGDIREAISDSEIVLMVVPTQKISSVCRRINDSAVTAPEMIVNLSKGIEEGTLRRVSQMIAGDWRGSSEESIVTLSGPSHAEEVARHIPTSVVIAGSENYTRRAQEMFSNEYFRVYRTSDIIGVELGGSLKNIIAIAAGIATGLGFGDNTLGALITRGLFEINRLAVEMGARPDTLAGLSGVGDLIATCTSKHSRNQYVGYHIGQGKTLDEVLSSMVMVAEGVTTCRSALALAKKHNIDMPITAAVYEVLFDNVPPRAAVVNLMTRPLKEEIWQ